MEKVTIEVSDRAARWARSPLYGIVGALAGVSASFAPLFIYWAGKDGVDITSGRVLSLWVMIFFVPGFHLYYGEKLIQALRCNKKEDSSAV